VAIAVDDTPAGDDGGLTRTLQTERRIVAGQAAEIRHWLYEDEDSRGVSIVLHELLPGKRIQVTGWMPQAMWKSRGREVLAILDTLAIAGRSAPVTATADQTGTGGKAVAGRTSSQAGTVALFDGVLGERWSEVSVAGGNFKAFARLDGGTLAVDVPAMSGWGKTGIWSRTALVPAGDPASARERRLTFRFDAERTTSFVVALGTRNDPDEWGGHDIRVAWYRSEDARSARMVLWLNQREVMAAKLGPAAPAELTLALMPDRSVLVRLPSGEQLEGQLGEGLWLAAFRVYALAHAPGAHKPARMALRSVVLATPAAVSASDPAASLDAPQSLTLFDGRLGGRWLAHEVHGGRFSEHARLDGRGLLVDVPAGAAWGKVGLVSPEPVVWLDRFAGAASVALEARFDAARTTGFIVALTAPRGVAGGDPDEPSVVLHWRQKAKGGARTTLVLNHRTRPPVLDLPGPETSPVSVRLVLLPGEVHLELDGKAAGIAKSDLLKSGQGLRVWVYSHPDEAQQPVRMALESIILHRKPGAAEAGPQPAAGVAPLPVVSLFDGRSGSGWEPIGVAGGDFARHAQWRNGNLAVDVPAKSSWGRVGLLSSKPIVDLDERVLVTPYRLEVKVEPKATTGLAIALGTARQADMWPTTRLWITLLRQADGSALLGIEQTRHLGWSRPVAASVMEQWDGRLIIAVGQSWANVALADSPPIRAETWFGHQTKLYASISSHAVREHEPARMVLQSVSAGWATPAGMTAAERWQLLDADRFDADAFLGEMAADLARDASGGGIAAQDAPQFLDAPQIAPAAPPAPAKNGGLLNQLGLVGTAHAAAPAPDCSKEIDAHIAEARRIAVTLGEQGNVKAALSKLGLTMLDQLKLTSGSAQEAVRSATNRMVKAWQEGALIGEAWNEDRAVEMGIQIGQAALMIGLRSPSLADRKAVSDVARQTWEKALADLPEERRRALIEQAMKAAGPRLEHHDILKKALEKGRKIDIGTVFGKGYEGEGRAALWVLTNNTLAAFSPHYAIGKEVANTVIEAAKATKAWVVNDSVGQMYKAWKQHVAGGGGAGAKDFYNAYTITGSMPAISETMAMMRKMKLDPKSTDEAERFLFQQFEKWHQAETAAGAKADHLANFKDAFASLKCRAALDRTVSGRTGTCEHELAAFKRYGELTAQISNRIRSWMQQGSRCNSPAAIDGETELLACRLLEWGEDDYKRSLGKWLEGCGLMDYGRQRDEAAQRVAERLPKLTDERLKALLARAGVSAPAGFLECLCSDGHAFHYYSGPNAGGSCRRIGALGGVSWSGFRVTDFRGCAKAYPLADGRSVIDAIADTLTAIHIDQKRR
jgi:hypothetical protein